MARRPRVIDRDRGWRAYRAGVKKAAGAHVKVGVTAEHGTAQKAPGADGEVQQDLTVAMVAFFNEFGTRWRKGPNKGKVHVPERSFIRSTFDENRPRLSAMMRRLARKVAHGMPVKTALAIAGEWLKSKTIQKIDRLKTPPNAPSTVRRKKSSNPLVDQGQLKQSVDYEVIAPKLGAGGV